MVLDNTFNIIVTKYQKTPYVLNKSVFLSFLKKWKREKNIDTALLTIQSLLNGFIIGANKRYHR